MEKSPTDAERSAGAGGSRQETSELARLLTAVLTQVRNDPFLRPPPLPQAALDAIIAYEINSGALNPSRNPAFNKSTTLRSKP